MMLRMMFRMMFRMMQSVVYMLSVQGRGHGVGSSDATAERLHNP